jgi:hypothetical protein
MAGIDPPDRGKIIIIEDEGVEDTTGKTVEKEREVERVEVPTESGLEEAVAGGSSALSASSTGTGRGGGLEECPPGGASGLVETSKGGKGKKKSRKATSTKSKVEEVGGIKAYEQQKKRRKKVKEGTRSRPKAKKLSFHDIGEEETVEKEEVLDLETGDELSTGQALSTGGELSTGQTLTAGAKLPTGQPLSTGDELSTGRPLPTGGVLAEALAGIEHGLKEVIGMMPSPGDKDWISAAVAEHQKETGGQAGSEEVEDPDTLSNIVNSVAQLSGMLPTEAEVERATNMEAIQQDTAEYLIDEGLPEAEKALAEALKNVTIHEQQKADIQMVEGEVTTEQGPVSMVCLGDQTKMPADKVPKTLMVVRPEEAERFSEAEQRSGVAEVRVQQPGGKVTGDSTVFGITTAPGTSVDVEMRETGSGSLEEGEVPATPGKGQPPKSQEVLPETDQRDLTIDPGTQVVTQRDKTTRERPLSTCPRSTRTSEFGRRRNRRRKI